MSIRNLIFEQKKHVLIWMGLSLIILSIVLAIKNKPEPVKAPTTFDMRLLACNNISDAQPNEFFNECLQVAKEGNWRAQSKIAWAYSQKGEYQNFEETYKWVSGLARYNRSAELMRYILLRVFGNNIEDREFGEEGIQRLANLNFAPASAYLGILYKLDENMLNQTSNSMWLLERAHRQDPEVLNAYQLAIIYANGFGVEQDYEKARNVLLTYAEHNFPVTTNNVAWFLATLEDNPLSSPETAITLANSVLEQQEFSTNHIYVDTLAATYAANGDYSIAADYQEQALGRLETIATDQQNRDFSGLLSEYQHRLSLYKDNKKAVTETLQREYDDFFESIKVFVERRLIARLNIHIETPPISKE